MKKIRDSSVDLKQLISRNFLLLLVLFLLAFVSNALAYLTTFIKVQKILYPKFPHVPESDAISPQKALNAGFYSFTLIGALLGYFFGGMLADRFGRKKILSFSLIAFCLFLLLDFMGSNVYGLILTHFCTSFFISAAFASILALIPDISPTSLLATAFGIFGGSTSIIYLALWSVPQIELTPSVEEAHMLGLFLVALLSSFVATIISVKMTNVTSSSEVDSYAMVKYEPEPMKLTKIVFIIILIVALSYSVFGYILNSNSDLSSLIAKNYIVTQQVFAFAGISRTVGGILADKFGRKIMMLFGCLTMPFVGAFHFVSSFSQFIWIYAITYFIDSISAPSYLSILVENISPRKRASILGLRLSCIEFASYATYVVFGGIHTYGDISTNMLVVPVLFLGLSIPLILMIKESRIIITRKENSYD